MTDLEDDAVEELWADVAAFLAGGLPEPPKPKALTRTDGHALFYAGKVNVIFGDPETGKSWVALAAVAQALTEGRKAAILDVDHNGLAETVTRLLTLGAPRAALMSPECFLYCEPEDGWALERAAVELAAWRPAVAVVDSLGEIMPMLGLSSNSPDDYTSAHRRILTRIARSGAAVVVVDHMPKSDDARAHGQTGTLAKRRAVNGTTLRVTLREPFSPGRGGACGLTIAKDRPGGLRAVCPTEGRNQPAGVFSMTPGPNGGISWRVSAPIATEPIRADEDDVEKLARLDPPPAGVRDVKARMGWGQDRASKALRAWRDAPSPRRTPYPPVEGGYAEYTTGSVPEYGGVRPEYTGTEGAP